MTPLISRYYRERGVFDRLKLSGGECSEVALCTPTTDEGFSSFGA